MSDDEPAKRPPRRRQGSTHVAIVFNVDYELPGLTPEDSQTSDDGSREPAEASPPAQPGSEWNDASRATVRELAEQIAEALGRDGSHVATLVPVDGDLSDLRATLEAISPACVFNLCESLGSDSRLETAVPVMLDLMGVPYTGSPPEALSAALYKDRVKERLVAAGVPTPAAAVLVRADDPCDVPLPAIVKPSREDGSAGITAASVVRDERTLRARVAENLQSFRAPCLVEEYIEGREFNVAMLGHPQARILPLQEIDFSQLPDDRPKIVTFDAKWREGSIDDIGTQPVVHPSLPEAVAARVRKVAADAFRVVGVRDYGRVDVRVASGGTPYVIDVNPNCDLSPGAGFARAAGAVGIDYPAMVRLIVRYALRRRSARPADRGETSRPSAAKEARRAGDARGASSTDAR